MKTVIFDLDGTLTESKSKITSEMVQAISDLQGNYDRDVVIISGCAWEQFKQQFIAEFKLGTHMQGMLHLMPTCGAQLYEYAGYEAGWYQVYNNDLNLREKAQIYVALYTAATIYNNFIAKGIDDMVMTPDCVEDFLSHGEIAEDRGSQVTFSMLGQKAPLKEKKLWDPDGEKRRHLVRFMNKELKGKFEIKIGGTTSIDVTKKGIDKAFGVLNIIEQLHITKEDVVFIGDALFEGGNDYPVKALGVECIGTSGPQETLNIINSLEKHNASI